MHRRHFLGLGVSALGYASLSGCASTPSGSVAFPRAGKAVIGAFGLDLDAGDASIRAGDNFYLHCSSTWLKNNPIPDDRTRWGTFDKLAAKAEEDVKRIVEDVSSRPAAGATEQKIGDYFRAYMNEVAVQAAGLAPIEPDIARIAACATHGDIVRVCADPALPTRLPITAFISLDQKNPDRYVVSVTHAGLGLPEREYYLKTDEKFVDIRAKYMVHIERLLTLAGQNEAASKARRILAVETEIAKLHWPVADRRDRDRTYNRRTRAELVALLSGFPTEAALSALGLDAQQDFVVRELDAMPRLAALHRVTPLDTWKAYATYHLIAGFSGLLPKPLEDEAFDFYGRTLNGQPQQRDRWKRAVDGLDDALGEAVGEVYVRGAFSPDAKAKMFALVENMRRAYGQRIDGLAWMTPATKAVAREKLAAFVVKIGYPDTWRDYTALEIRPDDPIGNDKRAGLFEWHRRVARINGPTERGEWNMTPQTVNASYNSTFNEITFPAAILQPPFFDPNADPAVNYGAIGGVVGHEMGHGFDDQGAKSDAHGVLRTWWSAGDIAAFKGLTDRLAAQYDQFEPLPGMKVNGRLTLGENIGDNGGLTVALTAYQIALHGQPAPVLANLTGEQRFFLSWAQVWRTQYRDERMRNQVLTDPHAPPEFRVNGTVRNMDAWYGAFDIAVTDKLYLPAEQRVHIW